MTSLLTGLLGEGPAAVTTHLIPDLDHFRGSFGAKHVIPLWRDAEGTKPNLTAGLLSAIGAVLGHAPDPEELFAYCYAILSSPNYAERFAEELNIPGPHVPLTRDPDLFRQAIALGERLIWLHTFGERSVPEGERAGQIPKGEALLTKAVAGTADDYPTNHHYDEATKRLHVGDGVFEPVSKEVRRFSVSGLDVIGSWLDYRMREGAGRKSSPLDDIRPDVWPASFSEELLRLIWIIERTVAMAPELNDLLEKVVSGPTIAARELPAPSARAARGLDPGESLSCSAPTPK